MTKTNDGGLRARMATLLKTPVPTLRKRLAVTGQDPAGMSRDAMVKALANAATTSTTAPKGPAPATTRPPKPRKPTKSTRDPRLPKVGATLKREFKGTSYEVVVEYDGFRYAGKHWRSLTAIAKEVTHYPAISGPLFWGITRPAAEPEAPKPATPAPVPTKKPGRPISKKRGG